ncbi:MAG: type II toxin-antitoxin system RelE/ParE family toxin [Candidatus Kapabacteria bacterium]|nr:type II toxin-antitoxin system RelE/ParE family toxin [Candidatus Kapabacteria bacterium]
MYRILIKKTALKSLDKLPLDILESINEKIFSLAKNPRPRGCKKLILKENLYRIRVSSYRIVYTIQDKILTIEIIKISKRDEVYKDL